MIDLLSSNIKAQSIIKNKAEKEIEALKKEMIAFSKYKVGDEIDSEWTYNCNDTKIYRPGDKFYEKLKIKSIVVVTIDGGQTWRLGYTLNFASKSYEFSVATPKIKGKKRKWRKDRIIFFEEDFLKKLDKVIIKDVRRIGRGL